MIIQYGVSLEFHALNEQSPSADLFSSCVILTPEGVRIARYVGEDYEPDEGQAVIDGFLRGGWWFTAVTHWAHLNGALPKEKDVRFLESLT